MEAKTCPICGKTFERDRRGSRRQWEQRRFCSLACAHRRQFPKGEGHAGWKGGRTTDPSGYIRIRVGPDHPMASMRLAHGYVQEHRLVMAESLGRPLRDDETVHHRNGDRADNRLENLELRVGRHGKGAAMCCAECGSTNLVPCSTWTIG